MYVLPIGISKGRAWTGSIVAKSSLSRYPVHRKRGRLGWFISAAGGPGATGQMKPT